MFNKFKYVFGQIFGMFLFVLCGFVGGYIYGVGEYINAEKRAAESNLETTETDSDQQLEEPETISFQGTSETAAERLAKVKAKAKKRPAAKQAPKPKPAPKPVSYSVPKKAAPIAAKKAKAPTKKRVAYSAQVKVRVTPAAQKPFLLSSLEGRNSGKSEIEENGAWSMEKKQAAAEAIRKQQAEKNALQKFFGL